MSWVAMSLPDDNPPSREVDTMRCMAFRRLTPALILAGMTACAPPSNASGDTDALADTLMALIGNAYDFDRPGVLDRMTALYPDSERVVSASGGQITLSADSVREGIVRFWEDAGRNMRNARWIWGDVHVDRLGPAAAVLTASWSIPHLTPDGQPHLIEGAWTAVFRNLGGEWKIVHEHLSVPPS
jgi:ketosteroid isomerase-like protein